MATTPEQLAAWQKAAIDATIACAQTTLASAEQIMRLNLEAARATLEQNVATARELMAVNDPQQLLQVRSQLAQNSMQQTASYAQSVYEIVSQTQTVLARLAEEQFARINQDMIKGVEQLGKNAPGAEVAVAAVKSSVAASSAMMESLNSAAKQFAEISEASIKAAAANMVNAAGKK